MQNADHSPLRRIFAVYALLCVLFVALAAVKVSPGFAVAIFVLAIVQILPAACMARNGL